MNDLFKKYLDIQAGRGQKMVDGGEVKSDNSVFQDLADSFAKAFNKPAPAPTPDPTLQDKYQKIRKQNRENFDNPEGHFEGGISGSTHIAQYADGGEAQPSPSPQSQEERDAESEEMTRREDEKKLQDEEESKPLKLAKGGKVKPEHDPKNLLELGKAFLKFLNEEKGEDPKMSSGGKVGSGERFAKLENKLSHQKGVTDPGALAASIGRKKYGAKKMNKLAQNARMADGGEVKDQDDHSVIVVDHDPSPSPSPAPNQDEINHRSIGNMFDNNDVQHFDGSAGSIVQPNAGPSQADIDSVNNDPAVLAALNAPDPGQQQLSPSAIAQLIQNQPAQTPQGPMPAYMQGPGRPSPANSGSFANNVTDQLNQLQMPGQYNGGKIKGYDDGGPVSSDDSNDQSTLQQLYQKYQDLTAPSYGSGMGDVQRADAASRALPVMTQGYSSPNDYKTAEDLQNDYRNIAGAGGPANNVTQRDVNNQNSAVNGAGGAIGSLKEIPGHSGQFDSQLSKMLDNYYQQGGGSSGHDAAIKLADQIKMHLADHAENGKSFVLVKDPNSNRIMKMFTDDAQFGSLAESKPVLTPQQQFRQSQVELKSKLNPNSTEQEVDSALKYQPDYDAPDIHKEHIMKMAQHPEVNSRILSGNDPGDELLMSARNLAEQNKAMKIPFSPEVQSALKSGNASYQHNDFDINHLKDLAAQGNKTAANYLRQLGIKGYNKGGKIQHFDGSDGSVVQPEVSAGDQTLREINDASNAEALGPETPVNDEQSNRGGEGAPEAYITEGQDAEQLADSGVTPDEDGNIQIDGDKALEKQKSDIADAVNAQQGQPSDLQKAQAQRDSNVNAANMGRFGNLIGAGIAGARGQHVTPISPSYYDALDKTANLPVQKYNEQISNQVNDPKSSVSQAAKALYKKVTGNDAPDTWSAADLGKVNPMFENYSKMQQQNETKKDIAASRAQQQQQFHEQMQFNKDQAATDKKDKAQENAYQWTQGQLNQMRGDKSMQQAESDLYAVQKANSLYNMYKDPNQANSTAFQLYATEVAKIASGGQSSIHELQGLNPNTIPSALGKAAQAASGKPTPANMGEFMKQFKAYSDLISKDAQNKIEDKYGRIIESNKKRIGDDYYKNLQDNYVDRFKKLAQEDAQPKTAAGQYAPGSIVNVKGKNMRVGADGDSLEEIQ